MPKLKQEKRNRAKRHHGHADALSKLRVKFIAANMTISALVMIAAFAAICYMDHNSAVNEIYRCLEQALNATEERHLFILNYESTFSESDALTNLRPTEDNKTAGSDTSNTAERAMPTPPRIGKAEADAPTTSVPVAVYYCDPNNNTAQLNEFSSATIPDSTLENALQKTCDSDNAHGFLNGSNLFFAKHEMDGGTIVAFADGSTATAWQSLAGKLAVAGIVALGVLFLINLAFSRWALEPVRKAWKQQHQFVADASHELKTPLAIILANNAILLERKNESISSQVKWIENTQIEAERMQGLITRMLDLARMDVEKAELKNGARMISASSIDLSRLVERGALAFESVAYEQGLSWTSSIEPGISTQGDAQRLQQLVAILLDNACKYANTCGWINVELHSKNRYVRLTVANSGEPIPKSDLPYLFDRFYRTSKPRTHNAHRDESLVHSEERALDISRTTFRPDGYGLGLAIAQEIACAHGGELSVTSTPEKTAFTLELPLT